MESLLLPGSPRTRRSLSGNSRERVSSCASLSSLPPPPRTRSRSPLLPRLPGPCVDRQQRGRFRPRRGSRSAVGHHQRVRASVSLSAAAAWVFSLVESAHGHADLGYARELLGTAPRLLPAGVAAVCGHDAAVCLCVVTEGVCEFFPTSPPFARVCARWNPHPPAVASLFIPDLSAGSCARVRVCVHPAWLCAPPAAIHAKPRRTFPAEQRGATAVGRGPRGDMRLESRTSPAAVAKLPVFLSTMTWSHLYGVAFRDVLESPVHPAPQHHLDVSLAFSQLYSVLFPSVVLQC